MSRHAQRRTSAEALAAARIAARDLAQIAAESFGLRPSPSPAPAAGGIPCHIQWGEAPIAACWIGQATTLLRVGGSTILTDPHFRERSGFKVGKRMFGRMRSTELPGEIHELPDIDLILLSHAHFDHWDKVSLRRLVNERTTVVVPHRTRRLVPGGFARVVELPAGGAAEVEGLTIRAIEPAHWGARWFLDRRRGCNAYLIEHETRRVLFAGDTAHTHAFDELDRVDLAILGIGNSYAPYDKHHATPEQAAEMARRMGAELLMPIHHSTFRAEREPLHEPLERLLAVYDPERIVCKRIGETWFG